MTGKWFDDFKRGELWTSRLQKVSEKEIKAFALLSGDHNPLHLDKKYTKKTVFKKPIAHGLLGLSLATGMLDDLGIVRKTVLAFVDLTWTFLAPIYPGDRIRLTLQVVQKKKSHKPDRGKVTFIAVVSNQKGEAVQEGSWKLLVYRRPIAKT